MHEIEILVQLQTPIDDALRVVGAVAAHQGTTEVRDVYYIDPARRDLAPDDKCKLKASFRLRERGSDYFVTYKHDRFDNNGCWVYSDEYETRVSDIETMKKIVISLGLQELVRVNMRKYIFTNDKYEIVIEDVCDLGSFLEVEAKIKDPLKTVEDIKGEIQHFINKLGLSTSREFDGGKPELLLRKKSGVHKNG